MLDEAACAKTVVVVRFVSTSPAGNAGCRSCFKSVCGKFLMANAACRDLSTIGDTVLIGVTKDGVRFSTTGDIGSANVTLR